MNEKVILVDADGVLLDWVYSFDMWMKRHNYSIKNPTQYSVGERYGLDDREGYRLAKMFNESSWIRKLPPYKDAIKYIKKLHSDHGYIFHVISSLSDDEYSQHLRTKNLRELFGDTVFEKYVYLDTGADKDEVLEFYRDSECWWIEDKPSNAEIGLRMGLRSILIRNPINSEASQRLRNTTDCLVVDNWKQIYDIIG